MPETVSRAMTDLSDRGFIAMETPSLVTICDAPQLFGLVYGDEKGSHSIEYSNLTAILNE